MELNLQGRPQVFLVSWGRTRGHDRCWRVRFSPSLPFWTAVLHSERAEDMSSSGSECDGGLGKGGRLTKSSV